MLSEIARYLEGEIKRSLELQKHKATGKLYDSIEVVAGTDEIIGYQEDYGGYVERGRKAGKLPPVSSIIEWVKAIGIAQGDEAVSVGWAISKSIEKKGIPGQPYKKWSEGNSIKRTEFLSDVLEANNDKIYTMIEIAFGKEVELKIDNIIKQWQSL